MSKAKINVRACFNGYIVDVNGTENIAKDKKEVSKIIGDIFAVSLDMLGDKKSLNLK